MLSFFQKIFGTKHQRDIKQMMPQVARINALEEEYQALSEDALKAKTGEFRERLAQGATLDDIMSEAFAVVKNACRRLVGTAETVCGHDLKWDMVPFDVQLIGAIVLHNGRIAEMATGEGKTLVATMPVYLNALGGKGVHVITVNDYLARRDAQWMGLVFEYLGLTVGCIQNQMSPDERREAYACDITYGTNSEFGFDYLRDNGMAFDDLHQVQRGHFYAIIDEVDSILIDEARTPLIISGPAPHSSNQYFELKPRVEQLVRKQRSLCNGMVTQLKKHLDAGETEQTQMLLYQVYHGMPKHKQLMHMLEEPAVRRLHEQVENVMLTDMRKEQARELREELYFTIDERGHDASLTEQGCETLNPQDPEAYVLPDLVTAMSELDGRGDEVSEEEKTRRRQEIQQTYSDRGEKIHNVDQLIRAYCLYERDVEYVVQDNRVLIVDEFTGRILPGRRWSDGLHQAVEAKEGVKIERETQTLATITIQNYFRMYAKLAGMTGTAETEANEFRDIYDLDVVVIPTNRPVRRVDANDRVYKSQREKFAAVVEEIRHYHELNLPVLVGTVTVDTSEILSRMLKRAGIVHNVLNAKQHEAEAEVVTRAGQPGAVTIATNMAGRGTDIKLGQGVVKLDRSLVLSPVELDDRVDGGQTVRRMLEETPGGLHVIASERHESRRIDRQLRGRCARQGDPGWSRFYVSLEDDLMRLFGSDRIAGIMERLGLEEGQELEHKWLNRSIETAQRRVEQHNYSIRKRTLEYDDVMNRQREVIYGFRGEVVRSEDIREQVFDILHDVILEQAEALPPEPDEKDRREFMEWVQMTFPIALRANDLDGCSDAEEIAGVVFDRVRRAYELKCQMEDPHAVEVMERQIVLQSIDTQWQDYLRSMDALRQGVGLRAYGQRDPLMEYKREAFEMFGQLMTGIKQDVASAVFRTTTNVEQFQSFLSSLPQTLVHDDVSLLGADGAPVRGANRRPVTPSAGGPRPGSHSGAGPTGGASQGATAVHRDTRKVGRNAPCPCGSGKKYKKCCGA